MDPISDPMQIEHPGLRDCAVQAALIDKIAEAVVELEGLVAVPIDLETEETWPWQVEPLAIALAIVRSFLETANHDLDDLVTDWLAEDPEHWAIFRLMLLDPWLSTPGQWRDGVPGWVFILGAKTALAQERSDLLLPTDDC